MEQALREAKAYDMDLRVYWGCDCQGQGNYSKGTQFKRRAGIHPAR